LIGHSWIEHRRPQGRTKEIGDLTGTPAEENREQADRASARLKVVDDVKDKAGRDRQGEGARSRD
jgi:hypothetical protein